MKTKRWKRWKEEGKKSKREQFKAFLLSDDRGLHRLPSKKHQKAGPAFLACFLRTSYFLFLPLFLLSFLCSAIPGAQGLLLMITARAVGAANSRAWSRVAARPSTSQLVLSLRPKARQRPLTEWQTGLACPQRARSQLLFHTSSAKVRKFLVLAVVFCMCIDVCAPRARRARQNKKTSLFAIPRSLISSKPGPFPS